MGTKKERISNIWGAAPMIETMAREGGQRSRRVNAGRRNLRLPEGICDPSPSQYMRSVPGEHKHLAVALSILGRMIGV